MDVGKGGAATAIGIITVRRDCQLDRLAWLVAECATEIGGDVLTMLNPQEHQTFIFFDNVPQGAEREYKIVLDPDNWINESSEDNNTKTRAYPGRS